MARLILEAQYFPPLDYFSKIILFNNISIEAHEHYQKGSYRNRCHIATSQGVHPLSVPLKKGKNAQMPIKEVQISYDVNWQRLHWQSLKTAYGSAPFWEHYAPVLEPFFLKKHAFLFDLNVDILYATLKILKINNYITVSFTENYAPISDVEFRMSETASSDIRNPKSEIDIADYRNLISPKTPAPFSTKYGQIFEDKLGFLPNLSILDLVFCAGNQALSILST